MRFPGFAHDSAADVSADGSIGYAYGGSNGQAIWTRGVGGLDLYSALDDGFYLDGMRLPGPLASSNVGRILSPSDIDGTGGAAFAVASTNGAISIVKWYGPGANNQQVVDTLNLPNGLAPDSVTLAPLAAWAPTNEGAQSRGDS
ncbi:MAG TPA: hypothetical protein VK446_12145 [Methylocystis sp.]|nr:hypothetical protein [Methylocystis sp.]